MTRSTLVIAIATALVGSVALAEHPTKHPLTSHPPHQEGVNVTTTGNSRADTVNRGTTNRSDERFLKDFSQVAAAEVDISRTAMHKAEDDEVKAFATQMVDAHSKTIGKVDVIATQANVDVKAKPDFMQIAKSTFIIDINVGESFDRAYMKAMVNDHEKIIAMLEQEIKDGQDENVKQFALETLPDVRKHLTMAQDLRSKVIAKQNANRSLPPNDSSTAEKLAISRQ
jgi:putative membrane protein